MKRALTEHEVRAIRRDYSRWYNAQSRWSMNALALRYGVNRSTIYNIVRGRYYKGVATMHQPVDTDMRKAAEELVDVIKRVKKKEGGADWGPYGPGPYPEEWKDICDRSTDLEDSL